MTDQLVAPPTVEAPPASWWRNAVIYQIYPRSFADSNGDGIGDLPGISSRLPYLKDLGVDAVWLSPFYASPQADAGYDVSDYRTVDPIFGTVADASELIAGAHALGLRVIVDLVPNHSSDQHEWFQKAIAEGPGSLFRERYHFRPGKGENGELPPNDWPSIFGGPAWTRVEDGEWYLHLFAPEQPDFNWEHPAVRDEFKTILRFWLDLGVDGFRIDVAHGLVKEDGLPDVGADAEWHLLGVGESPCFDRDGVHEIYRSWRQILDEYPGERIAVAEAWAPNLARVSHYVRDDELHQAFNFSYLGTAWNVHEQRQMIDDSLAAMTAVGAPTTWTLSNHDVVRHTTRLMQTADGEVAGRKAVAVDEAAGLRRARAASALMLALPGSAYLYQGEELGLPEVLDLPPEVRQDPAFHRATGQDGYRDGCRVPIPWSGDVAPYGFGPDGGASWLPQPASWARLSVAAQADVPGSTLELYRRALAVRKTDPALQGTDNLTWVTAPAGVLAFDRAVEGAPVFRCTVNMSDQPVAVGRPGELLLASGPVEGGPDEVVLPPDTTVWWSIPS
ncbi:alpha-glucosidase [Actinoplanes ianthinogenes]|uniref:Alpha-glucosidase n=1 Tax=Actinoplanes ianthinogenes TaxID=122358 RepID=A0ABN6CMW7_9ACTN|nr:glycoside hydrolase family 13 protein [Actinoplanes ianthinogenes]BCJ46466.1 alpha-glucosidase [Actinoplanes ianthinogenes]GGR34447.1 alpha-glucosidase [Actinoplanes ianthinogenes]